MAGVTELKAVIEQFLATGAWEGARLLSDEESKATRVGLLFGAVAGGEIQVGGHTVTIYLALPASFPEELPTVWLAEPDYLGFIPHVMVLGLICYHRSEGLVLNRRAPLALLQYALDTASETLRQGASGENRQDFMDEFASYWERLKPSYKVRSLIEPASCPKWVKVLFLEGKAEWLADSAADAGLYDQKELPGRVIKDALYVPLARETLLVPPRPERFWTLEDLRRLVDQHLTPENRQVLRRMLRKRTKKLSDELLVLGLPRSGGGETLVGIEFKQVPGSYPLLPGAGCAGHLPIAIERLDRTYLLPRGGAAVGLGSKHVLLIGCGAIGGHVAAALAAAGVGKLTLVDHDELKPENIFRHVVGKPGIGSKKAVWLGGELQWRYPFITVVSISKTIQEALEEKVVELSNFDAIVVALGVATVELTINEALHHLEDAPPTVFTWLEPVGIGGHALLTGGWARGWRRGGCMQCLYTPEEMDVTPFVANRAAFAAPGHDYTRDALGCGGVFVPFAGLDALRTAELAVRALLAAMQGADHDHPLLSWKGSAQAFLAEGYSLSDRYRQDEVMLWETRLGYRVAHCVVCGDAA